MNFVAAFVSHQMLWLYHMIQCPELIYEEEEVDIKVG
jgi:hypothetical protein